MTYDFYERLNFSIEEEKIDREKQLLKDYFLGSIKVEKSAMELDRQGVDYIVTLKDGAEVYIDVKTREKGVSKYWQNNEPELAIECWSVYPVQGKNGKPGWTFSQKSLTDFILYTFHPLDSVKTYLLPFQLLRIASQKNYFDWRKNYKCAFQSSTEWVSEAIFVPARVVCDAIYDVMGNLN